MFDNPFIFFFLIILSFFIVEKIKAVDYSLCRTLNSKLTRFFILGTILYLAQDRITFALILFIAYLLISEECYKRKWGKLLEKVEINDRQVSKCTIKEVEPIYTVPDINMDGKCGTHVEAYLGAEHYSM